VACGGAHDDGALGSGGAGPAAGTDGNGAAAGSTSSDAGAAAGGTDSGGGATTGGTGSGGTTATGGTGGGGAAAGGGGTGSGGAETGISAGIACYRYVAAVCERRAACTGRLVSQDCLANAEYCPELYFLPGSTRTVESLTSCAEIWSTFDCEATLRDELPACATPGTRAAGESCTGSVECASSLCLASDTDAPSTCAALAAPGGACPDGTRCVAGEHCESAICTPNELPVLGDEDVPVGDTGADCLNDRDCRDGLHCLFLPERVGLGRCGEVPGAGSPCAALQGNGVTLAAPSTCDAASYCGQDELCHELPALGEACGEARYNGVLRCGPDGYCETSDLTCRSRKGLGEPCQIGVITAAGRELTPQCDDTGGAGCNCAVGDEYCAERICSILLAPGDACGGEFTICGYGSSCLEGRCDYGDVTTGGAATGRAGTAGAAGGGAPPAGQ